MKKNTSNIFINPELVLSKIVDEQLFFPKYYVALGPELRNVHALLAMKSCWDYFEAREEYENIIPIKQQIDVFFKNSAPLSFYANVKDMSEMMLAPNTINEAELVIKSEMIRTGKASEYSFKHLNNIDVNINVARHFSYFYLPAVYNFVMISDFKNESNLLKEFYGNGVVEPEHMVFSLLKNVMSTF